MASAESLKEFVQVRWYAHDGDSTDWRQEAPRHTYTFNGKDDKPSTEICREGQDGTNCVMVNPISLDWSVLMLSIAPHELQTDVSGNAGESQRILLGHY